MLFAATPPRADADATAVTGPVTGNPDAGDADHLGGGNLLATASAPSLTGHLVEALSAMWAGAAERNDRPLPTADPDTVLERVGYALGVDPLPDRGVGARDALRSLCALAGWGAADAAHPFCAGHLHTPPLGAAVAADTVAAVLNQSMDRGGARSGDAGVRRGLRHQRSRDDRRHGEQPDGPAARSRRGVP